MGDGGLVGEAADGVGEGSVVCVSAVVCRRHVGLFGRGDVVVEYVLYWGKC